MNRAPSMKWQVELWPNRSLSKKGLRAFLLMLAGCFSVFFLMTALAPGSTPSRTGFSTVLLMVIPFIFLVFGFVVLAFTVNNRDGRYYERLRFDGEHLIVEAQHPSRPAKRWVFQPYWTRVFTQNTREVENQLIIRQRDRAVAIGGFLTAEERADLADEIKAAIRRFNGAQA